MYAKSRITFRTCCLDGMSDLHELGDVDDDREDDAGQDPFYNQFPPCSTLGVSRKRTETNE